MGTTYADVLGNIRAEVARRQVTQDQIALVLGVIVTIAYGIAMLWSLLSFAGGGQ